MNGNKQTGLTHLHVYTFVIYRMERGTVACILITACRSLRKIHGNSSHAFHEPLEVSATGLFQFLINEGDRVSYQIMLPYLLSTENINEFENIIQKRFFGVERFIRQGKNLYKFVKYTEERRDPIIWINDLEKGIIGWDMGLLVSLARASQACGHITKEKAWDYIEQAAKLCSLDLHTAEEIDKSFLLGKAMKSEKIEDWDRLLLCYSLLAKYRK